MNGFFITGTDTEIGKTFSAAALTHAFSARGRRVTPIKALAAGQALVDGQWVNEDVATLRAAQRLGLSDAQVGPLQFREPCAPHIAARLEGRAIEREPLLAAVHATAALGDLALVEGAGGFRIPLAEGWDSADLAVDLGLPVILVVGLRLGCINHALLTAEAIRARGLRLAAWVANTVDTRQPHVTDNLQALQTGLQAPCLGHLPRFPAPADPAAAVAHLNPAVVATLLD